MAYEIIKTFNGPLIKYGETQYVTVQEPHLLIEIAETNFGFMPELKAHIIDNLRTSVDELCEAFEDGLSHMSPTLNAYMNAAFMFNNFMNGPWANYQRAKLEGGFK